MHGIFISAPIAGLIYIAERSVKGQLKLLWSVMPELPLAPDQRIVSCQVPIKIRRQAYRFLGKKEVLT
jgi:hypothetical protein